MKYITLLTLLPALILYAAKDYNTSPESYSAVVSLVSDENSNTHIIVESPEAILRRVDIEGEFYDISGLTDESVTVREGWPELPVITRMVLVPPTTGVSVRINSIESRIDNNFRPLFVPPQDRPEPVNIQMIQPDEGYFKHHGWWPSEPVTISEPMIMRNYRLVAISIFPVQVSPITGEVKYNDVVDFELVYSGTGVNPLPSIDQRYRSASFDRMVDNLVINPPLRDGGYTGRGSYCVVYNNTQGVSNSIQPLLTWRARQGWEVRTIALQNPNAEQVRQQILNAYNQWTNPPEMVAIIGDVTGSFPIPCWENGTSDANYGLLVGNDNIPDVHYGRISCETLQDLDRVIGRIVSYEADPQMQDLDAYRRGAVVGSDNYGSSIRSISKWVKREARDRWGTVDVQEWYNSANQGMTGAAFAQREFERGILFFTYRGWIGMEGISSGLIMGFRSSNKMPFATPLTCGSGNYGTEATAQSEAFLRSPGGAVGAVGFSTSGTHTAYNNCFMAGMWHAAFKFEDYYFGSMVNWGRIEMVRHYAAYGDGSYVNFIKWGNLMGDPATHIWTGVPQRIQVTHTPSLPLGGSRVEVMVVRENDDEPLEGANVCLYKAANNFQDVRTTDVEGRVIFDIPPNTLTRGDLLITVSKHNIKPYLGRIAVDQAQAFIGTSTWAVRNDDNDDGLPNPSETLTLNVTLRNYGQSAVDGGFQAIMSTTSPWTFIISEEAWFERSLGVGEECSLDFDLMIDASAPNGLSIPFNIAVIYGDSIWNSMAAIQVRSPKMVADSVRFIGGPFTRGTVRDMNLFISNQGSLAMSPFTARIWSDRTAITFINSEVQYPSINVRSSAGSIAPYFRIRAHPFAIPGQIVTLTAALESESGFRDTVRISFNLGTPGFTDPFGPDKFGYVCFDSGDEGWEQRPVYDWVEIDPSVQGYHYRGTDTQINDGANNQDAGRAFNLPVPFTYYGREYNVITINSNGWAAFGDYADLVCPRNRRMLSGSFPGSLIAPFWDDMSTGRILYYWDAPRQRFIIEWNNMRSLSGNVGPQTFEAILYVNGDIIFQYRQISNTSTSSNTDTPFATVGICDHNNTDGLEYTYYNTYPQGARELAPGLAIKFTPNLEFRVGALTGTITDFATGLPIPNAEVLTTRGFWAQSDSSGHYLIDDILVGEGYRVTVSAPGYNDSTWAGENGRGLTVAERETLFVDFALLHPEFNIDQHRFDFQMLVDSTTQTGLHLSNDGNGTLNYTSRFAYIQGEQLARRDEPDEQWDTLRVWRIGNLVNDNVIQSVAYVYNQWIVAGGNNRQDTSYFYIFDRDGNYIDRMIQPIFSSYGIRDMEFYDGWLWCTTNTPLVLKVDPFSGEAVSQIAVNVRNFSPRNITVDPMTGIFYISAATGNLRQMRLEGDSVFVEIRNYQKLDPRDGSQIRENGLAWFRDDPDGYNLYLISNNDPTSNPNRADVSLYKMNINTGEIIFLSDLADNIPASAQGRGGMTITPKWNNMVWTLATILDNINDDLLVLYELAPNSSWIDYNPRSATLTAGESIPIEITVTSTDLDTGRYGVTIEFIHNAAGGVTRVPVNLDVVNELRPDIVEKSEIVSQWDLAQNYPNPFNSSCVIGYSLKEPSYVKLELFDIQGRRIMNLCDGKFNAGQYKISFNGSALPAGIYVYSLTTAKFSAKRKMLILK